MANFDKLDSAFEKLDKTESLKVVGGKGYTAGQRQFWNNLSRVVNYIANGFEGGRPGDLVGKIPSVPYNPRRK